MAEPKGPKVELPEGLAEELEQASLEEPETSPGPDAATPEATDAGEGTAEGTDGGGAAEPEEPELSPEQALRLELEELRDRYLRLGADFDNFRRRNLKEREDLHNYANENLIKELLGTVDNLERALQHARDAEGRAEPDTILEGVELTYRSLMQALEKFGVREVETEGAKFDPTVHEAIRQVPSAEHPPGTVVEVFQKGYLLKDRLLRAALVVVSSRPEGGG